MRQIIIGSVFIVGGLSGKLVLLGTNSSGLLIAVGVALVVSGAIEIVRNQRVGSPPEQKVKVGDQAIVDKTLVYTEMDSHSPSLTKLERGSKVEIVAVSEKDDVVWLRAKLPDGQQGYITGYGVEPLQ